MDQLNRSLLNTKDFGNIDIGTREKLPVKVIQFGEGNFLRAFVDYMIDKANGQGLFNGSICVVQPIDKGLVNMLKEQDGLYTVLLRGLENGKETVEKRVITSIQDYINPFDDFEKYINYAKSPDLRFFVSNTTEAGIVYKPCDMDEFPQKTFPAKATYFLYERFKAFSGDKDKGLVFIPCELIDDNGKNLKKCVLQHANDWDLGDDFIKWVEDSNYFTQTLVDRIVTGYPRNEIDSILDDLGYNDNLVNTAEIFHNFVIEGPTEISKELPLKEAGLNVLWTDNAKPYKLRKVRILNGAHTSTVLGAYSSGINTVSEMMDDEVFKKFLENELFNEIMPILPLPKEDVESFAASVFDRFANPFIEHFLLSISLNSVSKYRARVLPSILEYYEINNELPKHLVFSFACLLNFYRGEEIKDNILKGNREGKEYNISDNIEYLEFFRDIQKEDVKSIVTKTCGRVDMWGLDLNQIDGFTNLVIKYLVDINERGVRQTIEGGLS